MAINNTILLRPVPYFFFVFRGMHRYILCLRLIGFPDSCWLSFILLQKASIQTVLFEFYVLKNSMICYEKSLFCKCCSTVQCYTEISGQPNFDNFWMTWADFREVWLSTNHSEGPGTDGLLTHKFQLNFFSMVSSLVILFWVSSTEVSVLCTESTVVSTLKICICFAF